MAPSICQQNLPGGPTSSQISPTSTLSTAAATSMIGKMIPDLQQNYTPKENQRPPVYNPEDYILSLKKFCKRPNGNVIKSIYDTTDIDKSQSEIYNKSATLPSKYSEYKSPIPAPPNTECEMSLRQFNSITDLLTKLRSDLRASFPSFVQEFVSSPLDGVSLLLEVLRAIQLSQTLSNGNQQSNGTASIPRNSQTYQRRALLDELSCLQCLSICCCRSPEASARLGSTPIGLLPLAASATGQGIRARILALQLLTAACDKYAIGHGSQKSVSAGHIAVSEALSTLRLRCGEPVRFRLLIGMLNSGGGSGELQVFGLKFINTLLESAENLQNRLYFQAELFQAGFDPNNMTKTISSTSPWQDKLRAEIKRFDEIRIDVEKLQQQARDSERIRSQMVILERRVQILQEEKSVLTSMERRLQERCAELQRHIFRLQGIQNEQNFKSLEKRPNGLPRHIPPNSMGKSGSSEHDDEGISSSETGPSLSPVPILVLPQNSNNFNINVTNCSDKFENKDLAISTVNLVEDMLLNEEDVGQKILTREQDIVPVNLLPQPPRKSRSLSHLISAGGSDLDASEYALLIQHQNHPTNSYFEELDFEVDKSYQTTDALTQNEPQLVLSNHLNHVIHSSTNRDILDVIMNARQAEDDPTMKAFIRAHSTDKQIIGIQQQNHHHYQHPSAPAQHFNGVFFMTEMNRPQKYPKPDVTAALQARRINKNIDNIESLESMIDIVMSKPQENRSVSTSHPQIYFGGTPTIKINNEIQNSKLFASSMSIKETMIRTSSRTKSNTGSKVTDIPSGMY